MPQVKVLFVCMGNICRSPTAEGVFKRQVAEAGLEAHVLSDSAGTHDYHVGEPPDPRAQRAAAGRGYDLSALRGRQVGREDFAEFDYVLAMDEANLLVLTRQCPPQHQAKLRMLVDGRDVPDPYYGGPDGFERVLDMVEAGCLAILHELKGATS